MPVRRLMWRFVTTSLFALPIAVFSAPAFAEVMTLDRLLDIATKNSPYAKSWDLDQKAAASEIKSRDLVLSPSIVADASLSRDTRDALGKQSIEVGKVAFVESSLNFPFVTGTNVSLSASHEQIERNDIYGRSDEANWEARVSQSLWRDSFGRATQLRRESDDIELKIRRLQILQDRQTYIVAVENTYWDLLAAQKEYAIYQKNLSRRTALESWTQRRIQQFAAESQDLLQVQTLLGQLRLGLSAVENEIASAKMRLKQLIPGVDPASWSFDGNALETERNESTLVATSGDGVPTSIDAFLANLRAKQAKAQTQSIEDSLRPAVAPYLSYGTSGVETQIAGAWREASKAKHNVARIGITLAMDLDGNLKNERLSASRLSAESQVIKSEIANQESQLAWEDLRRRIVFLKAQAEAARKLAALQMRKVIAERTRFEQGRTTTLQMTAFEVDAADSELRLYQLLSDLRKTETAARNFVHEGTAQL